MANTLSQIYIQMVFVVRNRKALISTSWEEQLYKYITNIVQNKSQKMLAINGTSNHIHIFIGMKPTCCLSDLVREIKKSSNAFSRKKKSLHSNLNGKKVLVTTFGVHPKLKCGTAGAVPRASGLVWLMVNGVLFATNLSIVKRFHSVSDSIFPFIFNFPA